MRTIGRATSCSSSCSSHGYSVGSPPESMSTSMRPFSFARRASTEASTSASGAIALAAGPDSAKHVGQRRLQ